MNRRVLRLLLLLLSVCAIGGSLVSCETETVGPDGNIFLRRSPRYGHGGTEKPKYKYGATGAGTTEPGTKPPRDTKYLSDGDEGTRSEEGDRSSDPETGTGDTPPSETGNKPPPAEDSTAGSDPSPGSDPPADSKPKPASEDLPYATPVPGMDGHVYSPYYSAGYVDVRGMPSGSKARCPYTKKIFRVP